MKNEIPVAGVAHQAGTCRMGADPATSVRERRLPRARARQPLRRRHERLPEHRRGQPGVDRDGELASRRRPPARADGRPMEAPQSVIAPSGEQVELALGRAARGCRRGRRRAAVVLGRRRERDRRLRRRRDVPPPGRGQVLMPVAEPARGRQYEFGGRPHQLPLDEPGGERDPRARPLGGWSVAEREADRVVVEHMLHPRPGYPFSLALASSTRSPTTGSACGRRRRTSAATPCPYGTGAHPYLTVGTESVDSVLLRVPARTVLTPTSAASPSARAGRRNRVRLPQAATDRRDEARHTLHRPRARR